MTPRAGSRQAAPDAREQRRLGRHQRIAEVGLGLFLEHGYDETTLEMVAEAVGISRRTFFAYFKSKDEILRAWDRASWQTFLEAVRGISPDEDPLLAVRSLMQKGLARTDDARLRAIGKLMASKAALESTRHAAFAEREQLLFEALCEVWRQPQRSESLRMAAMVLVGTLRVAVEKWEQPGNRRSLSQHYREAGATLDGLLEAEG